MNRALVEETAHQEILVFLLQKLFPNGNISTNIRADTSVRNPSTGRHLEVDIRIPEYDICFEFQDRHHYVTTWYCHVPLAIVQAKDKTKVEELRRMGEWVVVIPCWWDGAVESLASTVYFERPDLLPPFASTLDSIPLNPQYDFFKYAGVPDVGELMLASFLHGSQNLADQISAITPWWMGEKYDGVRACWNPLHKKLYTRAGLELELEWNFYGFFSDEFLDGEIWFGRGHFLESQKLVKEMDSVLWQLLRFVAFDVVPIIDKSGPFETRYRSLLANIRIENPVVINAPRVLCVSYNQLSSFASSVMGDEGEGAIIRKTRSMYENGRNPFLLKIKTSRCDEEAVVMKIDEDESIHLKLPDGTMFAVTSQNVMVPTPKKGDIVTFAYDSLSSNGFPVNPRIFRIRKDISWEEVCRNSENLRESDIEEEESEEGSEIPTFRVFFENFAKKRNLDPLSPRTWYNVPRNEILVTKGGHRAVRGGYIKALTTAFPDIEFDESMFSLNLLSDHWRDIKNRRIYFDILARNENLDPLVPESWYGITTERLDIKTQAILQHYGGSFMDGLLHLYPEIGLDPYKFDEVSYWPHLLNRRKFFEDFARNNGFDPLVPEKWYFITKEKILNIKGGSTVLSYYEDSPAKALVSLFPDIGLDSTKLSPQPLYFYHNKENRRIFFENFARNEGFDPLVPENWYNVSRDRVTTLKGSGVLQYYNHSLTLGLLDLFPDIGLDATEFNKMSHRHWQDLGNQRLFFEQFALENGFDPRVAKNWYGIDKGQNLSTRKGASGVLYYHKGNFANALMSVFPDIGLEKAKLNMYSPAKKRV